MQNFPPLTQQQVRDLAWAVFSPNLVDDYTPHPLGTGVESCHIPLTAERRDWLMALNHKPAALLNHLEQHNNTRRLGYYFEVLWQFFLVTDPQFKLLAANLPIYRKNQTLGEFDLLYRDFSNDAVIHLELATKYYLETRPINTLNTRPILSDKLSNWLGPDPRDRLDLKLTRLLSHQIRLSELTEAQPPLLNMDIADTRKQIAMKGCLFYHWKNAPVTAPDYILLNAAHWRGRWLHCHELSGAITQHQHWCLLPRHQWLSPALIAGGDIEKNVTDSEQLPKRLTDAFATTGARAIMLCALQREGSIFYETERFMVTDEQWPVTEKATDDKC